ncbi:MAG: mechanosensitive ion channel family protein [Candidatus Saccharimonadales bacterium]
MMNSTQAWLNENWFPILLIIIAALLVRRFGDIVVASLIRRAVRHRVHGDYTDEDVKKRQNTLISMSSTVLRIMVWLVAGFTILRRFGIDLTPLLAGASVLGVAIGFGAQSLIKDFFSGLFIILENQYRVGDVVELDGANGTVEQITVRSTIVRDNDGSVHYIPNGTIMHAINKTMGYAKVNLAIAVTAKTDIDKLAKVINEIGQKMADEEKWKKKIIDPPHFLSIGTFTDTALEVKIIGKVQPAAQWSVPGELRKRLLAAVKKHDIELANMPATGAVTTGKK